MAWPQATISLGDVLATYELGLVLIAGHGDGVERTSTFATPVQWVHTSELLDPAPFLVPRMVLLTTGAQFTAPVDESVTDTYVERLVDAGVSALGFGVGLAHERIPHSLITACDRHGLPLFRVPYDTPFIAISQSAARQLAMVSYERELRSLETQRAISRAALRSGGVEAAIETAATHIGRWMALFTPSGTIVHVAPATASPLAETTWLRQEVLGLATRGSRANVVRRHADVRVHLQTVTGGSRARVDGVLAVDNTVPLDPSEHASLELVATLASINVAQHESLRSGEDALRSGVFSMLARGDVDGAQAVGHAADRELPDTDAFVLAVEERDVRKFDLAADLSVSVAQVPQALLARTEEGLFILTAVASLRRVEHALQQLGVRAGVSQQRPLSETGMAITEAQTALAHHPRGDAVLSRFSAHMGETLGTLMAQEQSLTKRARHLLTPLTDYDARNDEDLRGTLEEWLRWHGQYSRTATVLGVHRHTVASRIKLASTLLERNLEDAGVRAELWFALELTRR